MAKGKITICQETRPCEVTVWVKDPVNPGEERLQLFHGMWHAWRDDGREAIVELEDGLIVYPDPKFVRFLDSERLFSEYDWRKNENTSST